MVCLQAWPGAVWTPGPLRLCPTMAASPFTKSLPRSSTRYLYKDSQLAELDYESAKAIHLVLLDTLYGSYVKRHCFL